MSFEQRYVTSRSFVMVFTQLLSCEQDSDAAAADAKMDDAGAAPDAEAAAGTAPSDGGAAAADAAAEAADAAAEGPAAGADGAAAMPMETDAAAQPAAPAAKKRTKKLPVPVKAETASIPDPVVQVLTATPGDTCGVVAFPATQNYRWIVRK